MQRISTVAVALLVLICFGACKRPIPPAVDRNAIAATVNAFHEALSKGNEGAATDLLARDIQILEEGERETREEYLRGHLPADIAFAKAVSSMRNAMIVRQEGMTAWITETSQSKGRFNSREIDSIGTELMVLSKTPDGWRIRAIHWSSHANY